MTNTTPDIVRRSARGTDAGRRTVCAALLLVLGGGCATIVPGNLEHAIETTAESARFDLECRDVQPSVLKETRIDGAPDSSQYTIKMSGCGRDLVYVTSCVDESDCTAVRKPDQPLEFAPQVEP